MALICPKCLSDMAEVEHESVKVDICPGCRGLWLDKGELAELRGAMEDLPAAPDSIGAGDHYLEATTYICPRCSGSFDTFEFSPGTGLYIDRCQDCQGIYLDAGELAKIKNLGGRRKLLGVQTYAEPQNKLREALATERKPRLWSKPPSNKKGSGAGVYFFQLLTGLPVEVDAPRARFPIVTVALLLANLAVFLFSLHGVASPSAFIDQYAFVPARFFSGDDVTGLFTSLFLHGGWLHLLGNMYFLWVFGDNVEDRLKLSQFVIFYLFCGLAAALIHGVLTDQPLVPTIGASGAISGIMGAYLVLYPRRRMYQVFWFIQFKISVAFYLIFWLGLQVVYSGFHIGGVAWFAHIGGFVVGAAGIWLLNRAGMVRPDPFATEATKAS